MGKPLAKQTIKIMNFLRKHPDMKAFDVAYKFNIHVSRVYQLRRRIKDEELTGLVNDDLKKMEWSVSATDDGQMVAKQEVTPAKPKRLYVPRVVAEIAKKLDLSVAEYVKRIRENDPTAFEEPNDLTPDDDDTPGPTPEHEAEARASSAILDAKRTQKELEERLNKYFPARVDKILDERAKDYGKFIDGAEIMQMLKRLVHNYIEQRGTQLAFDQREAIDMIIHKLGRIINGNPDHVNSWRDIAGYATLVADRLEGNER